TTQSGPLTAVVETTAQYLDPNSNTVVAVPRKLVLRAPVDALASSPVIVSALSTEVLRTMQADALKYAEARQAIAARLSLANTPALPGDLTVTPAQVLSDLSMLDDAGARGALLFEEKALQNRAALAADVLGRGYATQLAVDPVKKVQDAQAIAWAPEDIPRYDHLFVIIFENHPNTVIDLPVFPDFYKYLNTEGNKAANYFSMGNPSEPNYVTLASGDDWGITNDSGWNCVPAGDTADLPTDVYNPRGTCTDDAVHNQKNRRNLFTSLYQAGLSARVYSESMDPGQDPRVDGLGNPDISGANKRTGQQEPFIADLYKTKHHPAMYFDEVRTRPDFFRNLNRTVGGGQWDDGIAAYAAANHISWNTHQLEDDLKSGDVGALNFIVPDQCDDIHTTGTQVSDCTEVAYVSTGILRGDAYAKYLVDTIEASPLWQNSARRVGIVLVFDEGSFFTGSSSCCGWNVGGGDTAGRPIGEPNDAPTAAYADGDKGDGPTIFGVLNNQAAAPRGVKDSDSYSHISFVRTLQDMYGLADPGVDDSYMNRSKYSESYIAAHLAQLTEYADSADPHFDAVRPMNHAYVMKAGDRESGGLVPGTSGGGSTGTGDFFALGPDPNQINIWALK
ncbi:MAG TPA: alkaline phosphatase family protein, partial [Nevskiaceae bacterium]|nr:alkaline phosphatase family protein [Nevskiaceae bacterium]